MIETELKSSAENCISAENNDLWFAISGIAKFRSAQELQIPLSRR
jgi:hypothetical protein